MHSVKAFVAVVAAAALCVAAAAQTTTTTTTTRTETMVNGDTTVVTRTVTTTTSSDPMASVSALLASAMAHGQVVVGQVAASADSASRHVVAIDTAVVGNVVTLLSALGDTALVVGRQAAGLTAQYGRQTVKALAEAARLTPEQADSIRAAVAVARDKIDELLRALTGADVK